MREEEERGGGGGFYNSERKNERRINELNKQTNKERSRREVSLFPFDPPISALSEENKKRKEGRERNTKRRENEEKRKTNTRDCS